MVFFFCHDNILTMEAGEARSWYFTRSRFILPSLMRPRQEDLVSRKPVGMLGAEYLGESVPSEFRESFEDSP